MAGEALARSDCGVRDFLVYANVGSETDTEEGGEGYMGIYRLGDGSPNHHRGRTPRRRNEAATSAAAGRGRTPTAPLLPLELRVEHHARCVTGLVMYFGQPVWGATLMLRASGKTIATGDADKAGAARVC